MNLNKALPVASAETTPPPIPQPVPPQEHGRLETVVYLFSLATAISTWLIALRAPLWLDETISYWQIEAGWSSISGRQGLSRPAYSYILWIATKLLGSNEIALRTPSILAMIGATYCLYLAASALFERNIALISVVVFCLNPIVVFAAIDARPYAFGVLTINAAVLCLVRLRYSNSYWLAATLGFLAGSILHFQLLFAVILPSLAICFLAWKSGDWKSRWRQFAIAMAGFAIAFLPVIPGMRYLFHTGAIHVFDEAPHIADLIFTIAAGWLLLHLRRRPHRRRCHSAKAQEQSL